MHPGFNSINCGCLLLGRALWFGRNPDWGSLGLGVMGLGRVKKRPFHWRSTRIHKSGLQVAAASGGRGSQRVKQHPINRFILGNIRYVPKKILGNSNIRMTTPGSGSNTPRFISVAFLIYMRATYTILYLNEHTLVESDEECGVLTPHSNLVAILECEVIVQVPRDKKLVLMNWDTSDVVDHDPVV